jgi:hypothetical protein
MTLTHQRCRPNRGGFSPASEIRSSGNQLRSMASLVCRPLAVAINTTVAPLAHIQGGHCRPHHHDTTNTSPHPTGRPPSRTPTAEATLAGARHPPPWLSNGHRGQRVHHADRARIRRHQKRKPSSSPHPSTEGHREADPATGGPPPPPPRKPPEGHRQGDCAKPPPRRARRQTRDLPSPPHPDTARPQGRQNQWSSKWIRRGHRRIRPPEPKKSPPWPPSKSTRGEEESEGPAAAFLATTRASGGRSGGGEGGGGAAAGARVSPG